MAEERFQEIAGSGLVRVTTQSDVRKAQKVLKRDIGEPLEGTNMSLFQSQIPIFWAENGLLPSQQWVPGNGFLADRVWIANRCIQMNAQQIASMPLRFESPNVAANGEPAWVSAPDPAYFPNGISDAVHAIVREMYGWGYAICAVTNRYYDGYPRSWTVLPSAHVNVRFENGSRFYKIGDEELDPRDVIQIDRNPGCGPHGTSALQAYAQLAWGLLAAGNQSMSLSQGGVPTTVLKNLTAPKLTAEQARGAQSDWMEAVARRNGAPPVLDKNWSFEGLGLSPKDLSLLETQDFNALAIAAAFGIPAVLLNMAIRFGMTYQNPGMLGEMWWRFELRPTAKRIADAFSAQMLPAGQWVWFDAADTYLPVATTGTNAAPLATDSDDPEAAAVAADTQSIRPAVANASPAQQPTPRLTAIGGRP